MLLAARYRPVVAAVMVLLLVASLASPRITAQPIPDDQPQIARWSERMERAIDLLERGATSEAIDQLEELRGAPPVRDRSEDYSRVLVLLARAYAWQGDADRSLARITEALELGYPVLRELTREDFALVRDDERFATLSAEARRLSVPWDRLRAIDADVLRWRDTLPLELRVLAVSTLWSQAKLAYAWFDRLDTASWDGIYLTTLVQAMVAPSTFELYRLLQRMVARLGDGHTGIVLPYELIDSTEYSPPVRTSLVEGRTLIIELLSPTLATGGLVVGDEIVAIDGVPVDAYVAGRVAPYISASTEQDRNVRAHEYYLLSGAADSPVRLTIRSADGAPLSEHVLYRTWCREDLLSGPSVDLRRLPGNIGYIAIKTFSDEYIVELFDLALEKLSTTSALIIDLRENTGGHSRLAFEVLRRLIRGQFSTHRWMTPMYRGYFHSRGRAVEWYREPAGRMTGIGSRVYAAPIVVLVGARTLSAAENFAVAFDYAGRGKLVGEPTAGSTGHTLEFLLPAGGACRITTTRDFYPDGRPFNGVGVMPQLVVRPSVESVRRGRDSALDVAIDAAQLLIEDSAIRESALEARGDDRQ